MPELSMTKPVLLPLLANFEPSPLRNRILQSVHLSLRRKMSIDQFYRGSDVYTNMIYAYHLFAPKDLPSPCQCLDRLRFPM